MSKSMTYVVAISHHQFAIADACAQLDLEQDVQADRLRVQSDMLTISTSRASGDVPVTVEVLAGMPAIIEAFWSVVIVAPISCLSGTLEFREVGPSTKTASVKITPGSYGVAVCMGAVDSVSYDSNQGADHYKLVLWPSSDVVEMDVRKTCSDMHKHRTQPLEPEDSCLARLANSDRHSRYSAIAELARYNTSSAHAVLEEAVGLGDEADRVFAVSSLYLCPTPHLVALRRAFEDESIRVRLQVLLVLSESDIRSEDSEIVHRIVENAKREPSLEHLAAYIGEGLAYLS